MADFLCAYLPSLYFLQRYVSSPLLPIFWSKWLFALTVDLLCFVSNLKKKFLPSPWKILKIFSYVFFQKFRALHFNFNNPFRAHCCLRWELRHPSSFCAGTSGGSRALFHSVPYGQRAAFTTAHTTVDDAWFCRQCRVGSDVWTHSANPDLSIGISIPSHSETHFNEKVLH